jgi:hypothetical protein
MLTKTRAAARIVRAAIDKHFPRLAVVVRLTREDDGLIDLVVRLHPEVRIFWIAGTQADVERVKAKWYVTPLRAASLSEIADEWDVEAVLTSRASGAVYERDARTGLIRINPLAAEGASHD